MFANRTHRSTAAVIALLIIVVAFGGMALAITMSGPDGAMNCPMMQHGGSLCPMGLDHVAMWEANLVASKDDISSFVFLLALTLFVFVVIRLVPVYSPSPGFVDALSFNNKGSSDPNRFGYLRAVLAQGILQPKIL